MSADFDVKALLARIPYAGFLGLEAELAGDELTVVLPYAERLIGNPTLPALHGGVLGAMMEMTAVLQISLALPQPRLPKTVDVTVQYLRSGRPIPTFARARIARLGRRVANVQVEAWQEARAEPISSLHGHFLLIDTPPEEPNASAA